MTLLLNGTGILLPGYNRYIYIIIHIILIGQSQDIARMKVGDIFELPENVLHIVGRQGRIKNEDETKILAKYEVVKIKDEFKGRVIVTYGNKKRKHD